MKKALIITAVLVAAVGLMFYVLLNNLEVPTHIHFTTREGALTNVIHYSEKPPEAPDQHDCDTHFTEMPSDVYPAQLGRWRQEYASR